MRAFVIAMECEAACVRPWLQPGDRLYVCGIGKVNAAAATQQALCAGATEIWNAGLCGGFGDRVEVGGVYAVGQAVEYDFDLAKLNGTRVGQLDGFDTPYLPFAPLSAACVRASLVLATGDRFNDSEADYALITKDLGASLRDMEGAAIAHVCLQANVPCFSVKCVTNVAGKGSMTGQYQANRERCLAILSAALGELLGV
ncbi:MAG: hypothetical protein ACI4RD_10840 [Kiritimatiellia bacterium]